MTYSRTPAAAHHATRSSRSIGPFDAVRASSVTALTRWCLLPFECRWLQLWSGATNPPQRTARGLSWSERLVEATTGFEPVSSGFADRRVEPLHHVASSPGILP